MRSFVKIKPSRNGEITLSFIGGGKSCLSREFLTSQICLLTLFVKIKFSLKFPNPCDRAYHRGLVYKPRKAGLTGSLLSWFSNYLSRGMRFPKNDILTSVDSDEPLQPCFKLRNSKWCSVSS